MLPVPTRLGHRHSSLDGRYDMGDSLRLNIAVDVVCGIVLARDIPVLHG